MTDPLDTHHGALYIMRMVGRDGRCLVMADVIPKLGLG
jgi:hypothetical protein